MPDRAVNLLGFMLPPWFKPALCAVALLGAFSAGWKVESLRWHAKDAARIVAEHKAQAKAQDHANQQGSEYEGSRQQARQNGLKGDVQIRTVYRDIPAPPAVCEPPADAQRVLRESISEANNRLAGQSGG